MALEETREKFEQIPNLLAVLTVAGGYEHVDRLAYSNSKGLALYYLREATRAFHAIKRSPGNLPEDVKKLIEEVNSDYLDFEIRTIQEKGNDTGKLREMLSYICSRALAKSSKYIKEK
ncbi:MAG: hypothetical protein LZ162_06090 [Thaumarchaeota archaeon]|jgi:hypothetical protein|nr:hypothetical protein [Candidatus Terraquivivens yellowstonensis]MCL7393178.1 hypothetical protein [Candidatus Terraquivivens yellowstonensis]